MVDSSSPSPADRAAFPPEDFCRVALRSELNRRRRVRAELLDGLPPPAVPAGGGRGSFRPDLWPPRPAHPSDLAPPRDRWGHENPEGTWDAGKLVALVREFAAARGPDFSKDEFLTWAGVGCGTVNRYCGSWRAARLAANLPPRPARGRQSRGTLHILLRVLHRNRRRRTPLTGPQLAAAAGVRVGAVDRLGGVAHLRELYRLWAAQHAAAAKSRDDAAA